MQNREKFSEFISYCQNNRIRKIHLIEPILFVNPSSADFGYIIFVFEHCVFVAAPCFVTDTGEDPEFDMKKFDKIDDVAKAGIDLCNIYMTFENNDGSLKFCREMNDSVDGSLWGTEWKCSKGYLHFFASDTAIIVTATESDWKTTEKSVFDPTAAIDEENFILFPNA